MDTLQTKVDFEETSVSQDISGFSCLWRHLVRKLCRHENGMEMFEPQTDLGESRGFSDEMHFWQSEAADAKWDLLFIDLRIELPHLDVQHLLPDDVLDDVILDAGQL